MVIKTTSGLCEAPAPVELGRRLRRREETSEKLLLAAMELFSRQGFAQTTVEEITRAADVGKGTFFNYFPSKEHVLGYLVGRQKGVIHHHLALAREAKMSCREILRSLGHSLTRLPGKSPEMARSLIRAFLGNVEVREHVMGEVTEGRRSIAEIIRLGQERGEVSDHIPPAEFARTYHCAMFGTVLMWVLDSSSSLEKQIDNTIGAIFPELGAHPRASRSRGAVVRSNAVKRERETR